jgi:hypothetical protein
MRSDAQIVVSADTDFGTLLAARTVGKPSVIQFRGRETASPTHGRIDRCAGQLRRFTTWPSRAAKSGATKFDRCNLPGKPQFEAYAPLALGAGGRALGSAVASQWRLASRAHHEGGPLDTSAIGYSAWPKVGRELLSCSREWAE